MEMCCGKVSGHSPGSTEDQSGLSAWRVVSQGRILRGDSQSAPHRAGPWRRNRSSAGKEGQGWVERVGSLSRCRGEKAGPRGGRRGA